MRQLLRSDSRGGEVSANDLSGEFDFVVVGTGPGGATVARELARAGKSVLMLERGRATPVTGGVLQTARDLLIPGRSLHLAGSLVLLRGGSMGGSSVFFFGSAWEPPYAQLAEHGLDIRDAVEEVKRELRPIAVPPELMGPRARRIADTAIALGFEWRPIPKFLELERLGASPMGMYAAPSYEAKWNARKTVEQALEAGAQLRTGAQAERVLSEGGAACGVEFSHERRRHRVMAKRVVVAAGGFGTPQILRASGIADAGREWFYDPLVSVVGAVEDLDADHELPMVAGCHLPEEGYMLTDITVPRWWFAMDAIRAGRPDRLLSYRRSLSVMVKIRDDLSGEITPRGAPGKPLTQEDRAKLAAGSRRARTILEQAGAGQIWSTGVAAVHPGGTAKVGDVVDTNLESRIPGLYVCDASVIPIPWGLPPSLTVLGLARRLARHLGAEGVEVRRSAAESRADVAERG